jgi:multiple sugar transport system substrate-binding protein
MARRSRILLIAVLTLFASASCGGSDDGGGGQAQPSASDTLVLMGFGQGDDIAQSRAKVATHAIAPAKVKNPEGAFDSQKFLSALASRNPPDLVYLDRQQVASLAAKGALEPLTSCIEDQKVDMGQYRQAALDEVTYRDEVYALPEFTNQRTLIVDDKVVQQAGLDESDIGTSDWDKLKQDAKQLATVEGGNVTRIGFDPKLPEFFPLWAKANGADLLSDDGLTAQLDDPKAIEALEFAVSLIDEQGGWHRFKAFRDTWDFFGSGNQVAKDQIGFWPMESWYFQVLAENSPQVKITAVPFEDRDGNPITFFSGSGWAIPKGAKNPDLACAWAKTMTATDTWLTAARNRARLAKQQNKPFTGLYTANKEADERILHEVYKPFDPQFDRAVELLVQVQDDAFALPASPAGDQFNQAMQDNINRALEGQLSPAAALHRAQQEAQAAIDEAVSGS